MTPREYLSQIRKLKARIAILVREIEELDTIGVGGIDYSKDRVQTSPASGAAFENNVERLVEKEQRLKELLVELVDARDRIVRQITAIDDARYMTVLYKHYIESESISQIAYEMHYSYNHVVKLHADALDAFKMMWNDVLTSY